jgi:UDP-N-acetylglucosamine:LPS N-acetylglucosamine transferase
MAPRILILTASIGAGHDLPAALLADALREEDAAADVVVADALTAAGPAVERMLLGGSEFDTRFGNLKFELGHRLVSEWRATRWLGGALSGAIGRGPLLRFVERYEPDLVVSTYPGSTDALGRARQAGRLGVPLVSAITDLASLRWWAHPGVDLHLVTHPESEAEVLSIAPGSRVEAVRGFSSPDFFTEHDPSTARAALGLPAEGPVVVVSGGGWAVGDLAGGIDAALALDGAFAVALCGTNDDLHRRLDEQFEATGRFRALGFTDRMPELLSAADVLVHSTAGLTVLEAHICGCAVISYGWGRGHIRANNAAFERFGLATVAGDKAALAAALPAAVAAPREPDGSFAELPSAASAVLGLARDHAADRG